MEDFLFKRAIATYESHREEILSVGDVREDEGGDLWCTVTVRLENGDEVQLEFVYHWARKDAIRTDDNGRINFFLFRDAANAARNAFVDYLNTKRKGLNA